MSVIMLPGLAASAAPLCAPAPAAIATGWNEWLYHWQTLVGAAVGGVMGASGALIVARAQRRRDQRVAAGMVLPDLMQLDAAGQSVQQRLGPPLHDPNMQEEERSRQQAARTDAALKLLIGRRPKLFALHTPAIGQLSDLDARLYSHLFQCQMIHRQFEDGIVALEAAPPTGTTVLGSPEVPPAPAPLRPPSGRTQIYRDWQLAVEHATLARFWLEHLVFSQWPRWLVNARLKRYLAGLPKYPDEPVQSPDEFVKRSAHLLRTGEIYDPATAGVRRSES